MNDIDNHPSIVEHESTFQYQNEKKTLTMRHFISNISVSNVFFGILRFIDICLCIIVLIASLSLEPYAHPYTPSILRFLYLEGLNILCPLLFLITILLSIRFKKKLWRRILLVIVLPLCFYFFLRIAATNLFLTSFCSHTTSIQDMGIYDERADIPEEFPRELPDNVKDPQYYYHYVNVSSCGWYAAVSWTYPTEAAMQLAMTQLDSLDAEVTHLGSQKIYNLYYGYFYRGSTQYPQQSLKIFFDLNTRTVYYVTTDENDEYPLDASQVFQWSPYVDEL